MGFFTQVIHVFQVVERSRNPFQGGMGFFTRDTIEIFPVSSPVAIPFRVGWGFSQEYRGKSGSRISGRNPFQGGMGFFTGRK